MARPLRVEFPHAAYHVMARGNERRAIYRADKDRHRFLETLGEMVERFGVRLHAYCLMPNHYHLLLDTPRGNLSQAVGWLQVTYTVRFNRRHRRSGHLFQGRFKAQLIEADEYAQGLVEYVHLNPVRPRQKNQPLAPDRAAELAAYRWSSHRVYAGLERQAPGWLCRDWMRYWGAERGVAQREYRRGIARWFAGAVPSPWEGLVGGLVLGGAALLAKAQAQLGEKARGDEAQWVARRQAGGLRERLGDLLSQEPDDRIKIWARVRVGGERAVVLARECGYRDGSGVTQVVRRVEQQSQANAEVRRKLARIRENLSIVKG